MDVRPHPHIGLATITYLLSGQIVHKDSLGSDRAIEPGDVNWMIAGKGIAHSERTPPEVRARGGLVHGLQTWVALPSREEECDPGFDHHPAAAIPEVKRPGAVLRVLAGTAYGARAPTRVVSPTIYVHARLDAGATLAVDEEHEQRAVYVVEGGVEIAGTSFAAGTMVVLRPGSVSVRAAVAPAVTQLVIVGGAPLDGPRHIWWNFVSSSEERIERAKADWRERRFPAIPGDDVEFVPLPER
jgi:redox-sensitive bicupin YhaK (pirin superfamily)